MTPSPRKYLINIGGTTAIGKTALALKLAAHFRTEIISCDSRQFYKELKIGVASPSEAELAEAKHHFIGHRSIFEPYTAGDFERDAMALLERLFQAHDVVVMVGGSGLYAKAITEGLDDFPEVNPKHRLDLIQLLNAEGLAPLQDQLMALDPVYYRQVDTRNPHRVIRALEVILSTGKPYSSYLNKGGSRRPFKTISLILTAERSVIYDRINRRVDDMIEKGLEQEAFGLKRYKSLNALQTVGYREFFEYFDGQTTREEAIDKIKQHTRNYAKRQLTWLRKSTEATAVPYNTDAETIVDIIRSKMSAV